MGDASVEVEFAWMNIVDVWDVVLSHGVILYVVRGQDCGGCARGWLVAGEQVSEFVVASPVGVDVDDAGVAGGMAVGAVLEDAGYVVAA